MGWDHIGKVDNYFLDLLVYYNIRVNLFDVALLGKVGVKVSSKSNRIVMTKNNVFVSKGFCNQRLFVLSLAEIMNENLMSIKTHWIFNPFF